MSGPPPGVGGSAGGGPPSAAQIQAMKEAGVRAEFVADIGMAMGPYVADLILLGVLTAQVWHWYTWTVKERNFIRIIVYWVLFWSAFTSCFVIAWFDYLLVDHFGTFAQFVDNTWFQWLPFIGQGVLLGCQLFNLERAYRLHHKAKWVLVAIIPFMLATTGAVIGIKVKTGSGSDFSRGSYAIRPFMYTYLSTILAVDILITVIIAWGLWKSKTGWKHTDVMIKRIIMFSWEAQLPPAICAMAMLVVFVSKPDSRLNFFFMICYAKVPAVAFMSVLNFRFSLRKDLSAQQLTTGGLDKHQYGDRTGGEGFQADADDIPMVVRYTDPPQVNSTDWQPPAMEKDRGNRI